MPSFKAPTGDTTASRIKTLVLHVERLRTRAEADEILQEIGVPRETLLDETRPISVAIWRRALEQFARRYGQDAIEQVVRDVVHPSNLGPWIHIVRNADTVTDGYRLLEGATTQLSSTTRIETIRVGHGLWCGRIQILHDTSLERGGLLASARKAELAAVPTLFGYAPAEVTEVASLERGDSYYEYECRWHEGDVGPLRHAIVVLVAIAFGVVGWYAFKIAGALVMAVIGTATGLIALRLLVLERQRKAQVHTHAMRIRALERSLELQDAPEPARVGDLDGQVIAGLYRLYARLGSGATGVIYEAVRLSDRASVAVKLLRAAVAQDSVASDRLAREAEALRLAWHPNVVELYDHGTLPDGSSYLVMELLRGESLATRLGRLKRFTSREILPIAEQICDALAAIHAAGVIHRDLKPSNIFLCEAQQNLRSSSAWVPKDPGAPRVKIFDFGIARVEWAETRITNIGVPLGTPGYMSPEQEAGEPIDARSDIYALGAILYECLTGHPPPLSHKQTTEGGTRSVPARWDRVARLDNVGHEAPLDPIWRALVEKMMSIDPANRYQDARAAGAAVAKIAERMISDSGEIPNESLPART
jgi:serine/threonine-protein kinase